MSLLEFFRPQKKTTANPSQRAFANRAERRSHDDPAPSYLPQLKEDILKCIAKYVEEVDPSMVDLTFEHKDDDISVLELNVKLPEDDK
ncbi:cell division topological specificity factor MinE [Vibrio chagasii]|nr:cell division topological specificity factor MinE [Vibrio chagasii]